MQERDSIGCVNSVVRQRNHAVIRWIVVIGRQWQIVDAVPRGHRVDNQFEELTVDVVQLPMSIDLLDELAAENDVVVKRAAADRRRSAQQPALLQDFEIQTGFTLKCVA
jgi:hypothetical protein